MNRVTYDSEFYDDDSLCDLESFNLKNGNHNGNSNISLCDFGGSNNYLEQFKTFEGLFDESERKIKKDYIVTKKIKVVKVGIKSETPNFTPKNNIFIPVLHIEAPLRVRSYKTYSIGQSYFSLEKYLFCLINKLLKILKKINK